MPRRLVVDACVVALLFAAAAAVASVQVRAFDRSGRRTAIDFGQYEFGAAVALACGHGFVDPGRTLTPGLTAFLNLKTDRFSCAELPSRLPARPPNFTQGLYRYLMATVAAVWMIRGVSWSALWPLFAVVYGATIAIVYGLARLAVGRVAGVFASLAVMTSVVQLTYLPLLRDYAKAPFILGLILLTAHVVRRADRPRAMLGFAVVFGVVLGIGFGFRNDILIVVPAFAVALWCWTLPRDAAAVTWRFACMVAAAGAFAATAWPILSAYAGGSNTGHVALLGMMMPFETPLGITASVYEWGYGYLDLFINTILRSYAYRVDGHVIAYLSPEYEQTAISYLAQIARHWPADVITRAFAAALHVLAFPFRVGLYANAAPMDVTSPAVLGFYGWHQALLHLLEGSAPLLTALALAAVSARSVARASLLLVALIYFAGYPAVQFQVRHFFHLECIVWIALAIVVERVVSTRASGDWRPQAKRALTFAVIAIAIVLLPVSVARAYQDRHVPVMLQRYAGAPRTPLPLDPVAEGGHTLLAAKTLWDARDRMAPVDAKYLVAEFSPRCGAVRLPVTFAYSSPGEAWDYSLDAVVNLASGSPTQVFFPAYDTDDGTRFAGVRVARGFEACVTSLAQITDIRPLPMLLVLTLPSGWQQTRMHQTITDWEPQPEPASADRRIETLPKQLTVRRADLDAPLDPVPAATFRAGIVRDDPSGRWIVRGTPDGPATSLVQLTAERRGPDDRFVIAGDVVRGGVTLGLLTGQTWAGDTNVTVATPGPFSAVLAPAVDGDYGVLFANASQDSWLVRNAGPRMLRVAGWFRRFTDVRIRKAGWITMPAKRVTK